MGKLRLYQIEAAIENFEKKKMLLADEMGLGKSATAITTNNLINKRQDYKGKTLIVCPNAVRQHWENEIKKWSSKGEDSLVQHLETETFDKDVHNGHDADFSILGYHTLSAFGKKPSKIFNLGNIGFQYGIIDEAHNAKNPSSIRSLSVKNLFDSMDYLTLLTGTPIPNSLVDIYMLLSLLDKDNFPITTQNPNAILRNFFSMFKQDPEFVKRVIDERMVNRTVEDYLKEGVPKAKYSDLEVILEGEHKQVYKQIYENDNIQPGIKLIELRKAALDPNLVNPIFLNGLESRVGNMESEAYKALDNQLKEVVQQGGKLLVFTDFKEGVTKKLKERYEKYGALLVQGGDGGMELREETRKKFQNNPKNKLLIATTVMNEGVDLTAATHVVHLTEPYTPAEVDQRNRRSHRFGEIKKDTVDISVIRPIIKDFPIITDGISNLLEDKRRIMNYIMKNPSLITKEDLEEIKNGKPEKSRKLTPYINVSNMVFGHLSTLKGMGSKKICSMYSKDSTTAKNIAELYSKHWNGYYGGNTANLYSQVIGTLEENEDLERKLDIGCGPFSLSRKIHEPVINVDINPYMLSAGKELEEKGTIVKGNKAIYGSFHQLPFTEQSFDLVLSSLGLHMSTYKERESTLREINRVLRNQGYGIITLPHGKINKGNLTKFYEGLDQLGFEVLPFSGFYKGAKNSGFKVYLAGLKKISESSSKPLEKDALIWKIDEGLNMSTNTSPNINKPLFYEKNNIKQEFVTDFFNTGTKKSLEESIKSIF